MLWISVADTPHKQEQGLMFVKEMESDAGMLFKFPQAKKLAFWGMNTYIPLDIAFVNSNNEIVDIKEIKPFNMSSVACDKECPMAIEANLDYFSSNGIKVGDTIEVKNCPYDGDFIVFNKKAIKQAQQSQTEEITVEEAEQLPYEQDDISLDSENEYDREQAWQMLQEQEQMLANDNAGIDSDYEDLETVYEDSVQFADDDLDEGFDGDFVEQGDEKPEMPMEGEFPEFGNAMNAIVWADNNNQSIWIDYETKSGRNIQRNIEPHGLFIPGTGNLVVVAFDETVNGIRAFIVNKINDFQFLGRSFNDKFVFTPN